MFKRIVTLPCIAALVWISTAASASNGLAEACRLHQDWVLSYLDAKPLGINPGGNGVGIGKLA